MPEYDDRAAACEDILRLLFAPLKPILECDAVAAVVCGGDRDVPVILASRLLTEGFASRLKDELVAGLHALSGDSHRECRGGELRSGPLGARGASEPWDGPPLATVDAPLIVEGRVTGLVRVMAARADAFSGDRSALIYAAAQQASTLLEQLCSARTGARARLESLAEGLQDGIVLADEELRVVLANSVARRLLAGLTGSPGEVAESLAGTPLSQLARDALAGKAGDGDFAFGEEGQRQISVAATPLVVDGAREGVVLVLRDVTDERLMQERLLQSEKMASVGQLVSGVAHELNNPLTGVMGFAQVLLGRELDSQTRQAVETIYSEAGRAARIVENLLAFARRKRAQKGLVDLNVLLERVLELRSYDFRVKNIDVELDLDPRLPRTMADPDQIQQVIFNIVTNAEHAMIKARGRGKLRVRSRAEKGQVLLSFTDDGVGVPPEDVHRVFDPFFTTKEGGEGTGLGLTISYGIVDDHGGRIRVSSRPGRGSTFTVELPVVEGPELPRPEPADRPPAMVEVSRRILVVDDEASILKLLGDVLAADGHRVDTASSGEKALALLAEHGYDAVISDIKMPGIGGQDLYNRLKEMDSELARHTIFITGDTVNPETQKFLQRIDNPCIPKPFKVDKIKEAVRRVLGDA